MGVIVSILLGFVPMFFFAWFVYWIDRYEKEPKILLGAVFFWGAIFAAGGAFIVNTILGIGIFGFTGSEELTNVATSSVVAPIIEETLKGFAVLLVFLIFRREFDTVLDGIIYGAISGLGFAATENSFYIYNFGYVENGWGGIVALFVIRVLLVGWQHPFYTSFTGIGLALARLNRNILIKLVAPFLGLGLAMLAHATHNTLATLMPSGVGGLATISCFDWIGWSFMFIFILWMLNRERKWIARQLQEEVALGVISQAQYRVACSSWAQMAARFGAFFSGRGGVTGRFYQLTAELAFKKQQRVALGEEGGNTAIIENLRAELAALAPRVSA
jgi:RsiW-degrading membrane proteinase PrsW (M82 family)